MEEKAGPSMQGNADPLPPSQFLSLQPTPVILSSAIRPHFDRIVAQLRSEIPFFCEILCESTTTLSSAKTSGFNDLSGGIFSTTSLLCRKILTIFRLLLTFVMCGMN
jgi:hypothetical protein